MLDVKDIGFLLVGEAYPRRRTGFVAVSPVGVVVHAIRSVVVRVCMDQMNETPRLLPFAAVV